jgi:molybdopterin synthase sulfur carrier subunit
VRIEVKLFATLREIFGTRRMEVAVENGTNIGELLNFVFDTPQRRVKVFGNGKLKSSIIILRNGRHIQHLEGIDTELSDGDSVAIFPPIAGG